MARFFVNLELSDNIEIILTGSVVNHMTVLRLKLGDLVELFNDQQNSYKAQIIKLNKKTALVRIIEEVPYYCSYTVSINLAMCVIANDKMDLLLQKATELGVHSLYPIISSKTQNKGKIQLDKKLQRWQSIIISSCEQCELNYIPKLNAVSTIKEFIDHSIITPEKTLNFIMSTRYSFIDPICNSNTKYKTINLMVGPEGGFTQEEINYAIDHSFIPLKLGCLTMRAETAAIAGITTLRTKFDNWVN